jgi:hypothetical protein
MQSADPEAYESPTDCIFLLVKALFVSLCPFPSRQKFVAPVGEDWSPPDREEKRKALACRVDVLHRSNRTEMYSKEDERTRRVVQYARHRPCFLAPSNAGLRGIELAGVKTYELPYLWWLPQSPFTLSLCRHIRTDKSKAPRPHHILAAMFHNTPRASWHRQLISRRLCLAAGLRGWVSSFLPPVVITYWASIPRAHTHINHSTAHAILIYGTHAVCDAYLTSGQAAWHLARP